jgi:hypothetical protein
MKYIITIAGILLMVSAGFGTDISINELQIGQQGKEVYLKIKTEGPCQYTHEIAEAKDGKPFRVVVDVFPAVHDLPMKNFSDVPASVISSLRTSQYSVNPEKVVRVVLDLNQTVVYRIEKKGDWIWLYVPDNNVTAFPVWSSTKQTPLKKQQSVAKKSVAQKPARTDADKPEIKSEVKTLSEPPVTSAKKFAYQRPESSSFQDWRGDSEKQVTNTITAKNKSEKPTKPLASSQEKKSADTPKAVKKTQSDKNVAPEPVRQPMTTALTSPVKTDNKAIEKSSAKKNVMAKKEKSQKAAPSKSKATVTKADDAKKTASSKEVKKVKKNTSSEKANTNKTSPVVANKSTEKADNKKQTSRFRRKPAFSNKLKGTIVAEFPKRMVIKYRSGSPRDPFASLIDKEAKSNDEPTATKIPNVETSRLVGVLESTDGKNRALLEDVDGFGYILKQGDKVRKGYLSKIYSDKALFQLFEYGWSRTVALRLSDD